MIRPRAKWNGRERTRSGESGRHRAVHFALLVLLAAAPGCGLGRLISLRVMAKEDDEDARLVFNGNRTFDDRVLRRVLEPWRKDLEQSEIPESVADDAAYEVALHYQENGFAFVQVDYQVIPQRDGARLLLRIQEGPRVRLKTVQLEGVVAFDENELIPLFTSSEIDPLELEALGANRVWYVKRRVDSAASDVVALYFDRGYLDAKVLDIQPTFNAARSEATVLVHIEEGPRYTVDEVVFKGNLEGLGTPARAAAGLASGDPYTPWRAAEARARVMDFYNRMGYLFARAELTEQRIGTRVLLTLDVDAGDRRRLRQIRLLGLRKSQPWSVLSIADLPQDEILTRDAIRHAYRRLAGSGLYRTVELEPEIVRQEPDRVDLTIKVEERPSIVMGVLGGYGSYERTRVGLDLKDRNLLGVGLAGSLQAKASEKGWRSQAGLTNRYFLGSELQHTLAGYALKREEVSFLREERGGESGFAYDLTRRLRLDLTYRIAVTDATEIQGGGATAGDVTEARTSAVSIGARWDLRDRPTEPTEGLLFYLRAENAGDFLASESEFLRLTGGASFMVPVFRQLIFAAGVRGGSIRPQDGSTIGIQDRFFAGGSTTVRSFEEGTLGPKSTTGASLGGEAMTLANVELRLRLPGEWGLAVFGDAGKVAASYRDIDFEDLKYAVGGGLHYRTPMGPIRLDFGHNPRREKGEPTSVWFFSVGHPF